MDETIISIYSLASKCHKILRLTRRYYVFTTTFYLLILFENQLMEYVTCLMVNNSSFLYFWIKNQTYPVLWFFSYMFTNIFDKYVYFIVYFVNYMCRWFHDWAMLCFLLNNNVLEKYYSISSYKLNKTKINVKK